MFSIVSAATVLLALFISDRPANSSLVHANKLQPSRIGDSCLGENELSIELGNLSFAESYAQQTKIVDLLTRNARKSVQCRKRVIAALVKAMDKPDLDLRRDRPSFYLWHYGSEILSNLKATEALDFLIAHLALDDGTAFPFNHHPAMNALVRMGQVAMPNLDTALRKSRDPYERRLIIFCIGWLGGRSARKNLEQALAVEDDACVRSFMRSTLVALNNKQHQITSSDRLKWYGSFHCDAQ